jgi:hypothetical protein
MEATKTVTKTNKMPAEKKTKSAPAPAPTVAPTTTAPVTEEKKVRAPRRVAAKAEVTVPVIETSAVETVAVVEKPDEARSAAVLLAELQDHLKALGSDFVGKLFAVILFKF